MLNKFYNSCLLLGLLLLPVQALAVPADIEGLAVSYQPDGVHLTWEPAVSDDTAYYRIYYNDISILDSGGDWADFERTDGAETLYVFTESPLGTNPLYVSVLAIDAAGDESEYFIEEAEIDFRTTPEIPLPEPEPEPEPEPVPEIEEEPQEPEPVPEIEEVPEVEPEPEEPPAQEISEEKEPEENSETEEPSEEAPGFWSSFLSGFGGNDEPEESTISILSAEPQSPTEIVIQLSSDVVVAENGASGISIMTREGEPLDFIITGIDGGSIVLNTAVQQSGQVYELSITEDLLADDSQTVVTGESLLFTGHSDGSLGQETTEDIDIADVDNIRLTKKPEPSGMYQVDISWNYPGNTEHVEHFLLHQSRDGGQTFRGEQRIPADVDTVTLTGAEPGVLDIRIVTVAVNGELSRGVYERIIIGDRAPQVPPPNFQGSITNRPPMPPMRSDHLAHTGVGLLGALIGAAGATGGLQVLRVFRKKK